MAKKNGNATATETATATASQASGSVDPFEPDASLEGASGEDLAARVDGASGSEADEDSRKRAMVYIRVEGRVPGTSEYDQAIDLITRMMGGPATLISSLVGKYGLDLAKFQLGGIREIAASLTPENVETLRMFNKNI